MNPTQKDLINTDGENRAVRAFLLGREVGCKDYEQMQRHMTNSGFNNCWPSEFAGLGGHMSKGDQQMWLRHLFALERFGAGGWKPVAYVCPSSHVTADGSMEDGPDYLEWADEASDYEKRVPLTREHVRASGGIVHSDGNVFFTSLDQLNRAIERAHGINVPQARGEQE